MRRILLERLFVLSVVACGLVAVPAARPAFGQGGVSGTIVGGVYDQTGSPLKGVKVTAKSDTQIGGPKTVYTNDEGYFRLVGLQPGIFEIAATAPKLRTVIQQGINVGVSGTESIDLLMEVETQVEEVKVIEKAPLVDVTTANVNQTFDAEFLDMLPVESRMGVISMVAQQTPGIVQDGGSHRFRGGGGNQNVYSVEGFQVNGQPVTFGSLAAIEVQTAGYGAENANVPGGVINMVSKSGSNRYEFDVNGWVEDGRLQFFRDATDVGAPSFNYYLNPSISGPIVKDRLWFYANTDFRLQLDGREKDVTGLLGNPRPKNTRVNRGSVKLTWQITPRNKLSSFTSYRLSDVQNQGTIGRDEADAFKHTARNDYFTGLIWELLLGENLFLRSQIGFQQQHEDEAPMLCLTDSIDCEHIKQFRNTSPNVRLGNTDLHEQIIFRSVEVTNQLEAFLHSKVFGEHDLKVRSRVFVQQFEDAQSTPGDSYVQHSGETPDRERTYYANDPRLEEARFGWRIRGTTGLTTVHSLSDVVRLTRYLTFTPGIAYTTAKAANVGRQADLDSAALTPHLSVAWDATHDGRTVVRGSFNQYIDTDALRLARFAFGDRVWRECLWNPETQTFDRSCQWGGGAGAATFGLPCGPSGVNPDGTPCKERLRTPKTWEYTAGAEREIVPGVGLGADLVYRLYTYPYENRETNRLWAPSGYELDRTGGFRDGTNRTVIDLSTPANARRRYLGVTAQLRKREGAFKGNLSYTWARLEGNVLDNENNDFGNNPARDAFYAYGYLPDDFRHNLRASATWQPTAWLSGGFIYRYRSGTPIQRRFRNDVEGAFRDFRATTGVDPGTNINDPGDDRPLRRPDIQEINLQARVRFKPLIGVNLEGYADVLNLLALRPPTAMIEDDGPTWGQPTTRMPPMRVRLGFRYRF